MALSEHDKKYLSPDQQGEILKQTQAWETAQAAGDSAGMTAANEAANRIRAMFGYSGGAEGTGYSAVRSDLSPYLEDRYAQQEQAAVDAYTAAQNRGLAELDRSAEKIPAAYESARNQAAVQSEMAGQRWNEYAAASGLNTGAGGQAALARSGALQGALGSINQAQAQALSDLEFQRGQVVSEYQALIAQAIKENNAAKMQALYNEAMRSESQFDERAQRISDEVYRDKLYDYQVGRDEYTDDYTRQRDEYAMSQDEWTRNMTIAEALYRVTGDVSWFAKMGIVDMGDLPSYYGGGYGGGYGGWPPAAPVQETQEVPFSEMWRSLLDARKPASEWVAESVAASKPQASPAPAPAKAAIKPAGDWVAEAVAKSKAQNVSAVSNIGMEAIRNARGW